MKILDATAGNRAMWFDKNCPLATFIDVRPEVKPDRVEDCTNTSFPERIFDLVVFDPPHVNCGASSSMGKTYGHFTTAQIKELCRKAFAEFYRVLKDGGFVIFKWNDHDTKLDTVLSLATPFLSPLFGQRVATRTKHSSSTYWVCLCKSDLFKISSQGTFDLT